MTSKTLKTLEYDKILQSVSEFAVLDLTKRKIAEFEPDLTKKNAEFLLAKTSESYKLLFNYSVPEIFYYGDVSGELKRVDAGGVLNAAEILKIAAALKSARIAKTSILSVNDESLKVIPQIAERLYVNFDFEKEVSSKIISEDEISDNASPKLFSIRKTIRNLNAKIRDTLNSYMRGSFGKYLQESVITLRQNRYVIPVKSEYRSFVKGFIHDQSSTGATVFIEPESVMELNNDLKRANFDEAEEIRKILYDLTVKISAMTSALYFNAENLSELDFSYASAIYSFKNKYTLPILNDKGKLRIINGKHPLIKKEKVIPVSVNLGEEYNFLLITGPNTGGKTVTLKLVGLCVLMAASGLFIPADENSEICIFEKIFCDIGDEQSIEQSLSTFSSHISNVKNILDNADGKSLVLLDEIGAGTDPEEGSALALAIIKKLLSYNCFGVITTHYNGLKEFAEINGKIANASMRFDSKTLKPLYRLDVGIPGSSNAIDIAKTLGLSDDVISDAERNIKSEKLSFERVLKKAEESRRVADELKEKLETLEKEKENELNLIKSEKEKIAAERQRISANAKSEIKRIVADRLDEAEEIIDELKSILKKADLESKEVFKASELKNRLKNSRYLNIDEQDAPVFMKKADKRELKTGDKVYVKSLGAYGYIVSVKNKKDEVEVRIGNARTLVSACDIFDREPQQENVEKVIVKRSGVNNLRSAEINVVGKNSLDAIDDVAAFIDRAVMSGVEEIKIIHGVGEGILLKEIRNYLKGDDRVKEFRKGIYGEGENGVTFVKLK